jgi:hypothetical protein
MDARRILYPAAGWLAVAAALALLSPGVRAVRADESAQSSSGYEEGPVCRAESNPDPVPNLALWIDRVRAEAEATAPQADDEYVVLNNRGYNYGRPAMPEGALDPIERELQ